MVQKLLQTVNVAALVCLVGWVGYDALGTNVFGSRPWPDTMVDYHILHEQSSYLVTHKTYMPGGAEYAYPPSAAILHYAVAGFPIAVAAAMWLTLTIVSALAIWWLLARMLELEQSPIGGVLVLLAYGSSCYFFQWDLRSQNCNLIFLAAVLLGTCCLSRGRSGGAGFWLALSFSLKLFSILLIPYLLWRGWWRSFLWTLAFLGLFWGVLPALVFGVDGMQVLYADWLGQMAHVSKDGADWNHPILISLNKEKHAPTRDYEVLLRKRLHERFPDMVFFFQPANITSQILNFGLPAPIDLQVVGRNAEANYAIAQNLARRISRIPGAADVHVHQVADQPVIRLDVDRTRASQMGLTQRDVTGSMLISLSGSGTVAPNFWMNWTNGVNYNIGVQTPQYRIDSLDALLRTPISAASNEVNTTTPGSLAGASAAGPAAIGASPSGNSQAYGNPGAAPGGTELLANLASARRSYMPVIINHYNVWPVFDVFANVDRRDLGGVGSEVLKIMQDEEPHLPRGTSFSLRGQVETMRSSFFRLGLGLVFAVVLVYLLMTVNFQSWLDPFIILMALPGATAGILWMLFLTATPLSVPSLMGAMMCIGVATANSILIVTFANDERATGLSATEAMLSAGRERVRPVLMTATAMILGMIPMALGMGEGGEQNAPLGRAVIGGLVFATVTTLFVVPIIYSYLRTNRPVDHQRRLEELNAR